MLVNADLLYAKTVATNINIITLLVCAILEKTVRPPPASNPRQTTIWYHDFLTLMRIRC